MDLAPRKKQKLLIYIQVYGMVYTTGSYRRRQRRIRRRSRKRNRQRRRTRHSGRHNRRNVCMNNRNRCQSQATVQPPDGHHVPRVFCVRMRLLEPQVSDFSPQGSHFLLAEGKGVSQLLVLLHLRLQVAYLLLGGRETGRHEVQLGAEPDLVSV